MEVKQKKIRRQKSTPASVKSDSLLNQNYSTKAGGQMAREKSQGNAKAMTDKIFKIYDGDSLEAQANSLLRSVGSLDNSRISGIYTEHQLQRQKRLRRELSIENVFESQICNFTPLTDLQCIDSYELMKAAQRLCNDHQYKILQRRFEQRKIKEIADELCMSERYVYDELRSIAIKINAVDGFGLISVLSEIFRLPASVIRDILRN